MPRRNFTVRDTMTVERDGLEFDVTLHSFYYPATPDVWYMRNGDPGLPGDPPELDDITALDRAGAEISLTDAELVLATEILMEAGQEQLAEREGE